MDEFPIESNIPPPKAGVEKYPFDTMQPGDSFTVPLEAITGARAAFQTWAKAHPGTKFTSKKEPNGRCRIWRLT